MRGFVTRRLDRLKGVEEIQTGRNLRMLYTPEFEVSWWVESCSFI